MAEGNERSGKSYGGGHKGYGDRRPGNRGGKGFKPRGKGAVSSRVMMVRVSSRVAVRMARLRAAP